MLYKQKLKQTYYTCLIFSCAGHTDLSTFFQLRSFQVFSIIVNVHCRLSIIRYEVYFIWAPPISFSIVDVLKVPTNDMLLQLTKYKFTYNIISKYIHTIKIDHRIQFIKTLYLSINVFLIVT